MYCKCAVQGIAALNLTYSTTVPRFCTCQHSEGASAAMLCTTYSNELQPKIGGVLICRPSENLGQGRNAQESRLANPYSTRQAWHSVFE